MRLFGLVKGGDVYEESFGHFCETECDIDKHFHRASCHLVIVVVGIFVKLVEKIPEVELVGQQSKDSDLDGLDVGRFVDSAVEILEVQLVAPLPSHVLNHILNVLQHNEGNLETTFALVAAHECQQRCLGLFDDVIEQLLLLAGKLQDNPY